MTKTGRVEEQLKNSAEHVLFLKKEVPAQSHQLLFKHDTATRLCGSVVELEKQMDSLSADIQRHEL